MRKNIGFVLLVLGIGCGIYAFTNSKEDKAEVDIAGIKLSAEDKSATNKTTTLYIVAGLCVLVGAGLVVRK